MTEIVNRVSESGLLTIDLENYSVNETLYGIDIAEQLWQGLALKEKDFRDWIKENNWELYKGKQVYVFCSVDAIIPTWAYMLIGSALVNIAADFMVGTKDELAQKIIKENIQKLDTKSVQDKRVVIKGCSDIIAPNFAMVELVKHIQPVVKSIMFGEPCSTVPIYKQKKKTDS